MHFPDSSRHDPHQPYWEIDMQMFKIKQSQLKKKHVTIFTCHYAVFFKDKS